MLPRNDFHVFYATGNKEQIPGTGPGTLHVVRIQGEIPERERGAKQ